MSKFFNRLHTKIIIFLLLFSTLSAGIYQVYIYYDLKGQWTQELEEDANKKISRLKRDLELPLWELDKEWIDKIILSESIDKNVDTIVVLENENILSIFERAGQIEDKDADHIFRSEFILHNGEMIGEVQLLISKRLMNKRLQDRTLQVYENTLGLIVFASFFLWIMLNYLIISPVKSLVELTKYISSGNYDQPIFFKLRNDEIGELGNSIDKMQNEIKSRENELRLSKMESEALKERLEYAVSGTQDGLWDWNIETNEVYFSVRWKEMLGYKDDELENEFDSWENNVHPDDIEGTKMDISFAHEKPGGLYENIHRLRHKDGSWVWVLARGQTLYNEDGKAVRMVGFHTDITKQKNLEKELLEREELMIAQSRQAAMGEMIGMIAHQWRQPITVISMGANNILVDIELNEVNEDALKESADGILKQTEYLSKTIDDFRNFFRPNKKKDEVRIYDIAREAKQIMGKSLEYHNITLSVEESNSKPLFIYSRELLQVFLNIIKNSKEAFELRGRKNAYIKVDIEDVKDEVIINITDNAGGIDESIINKIFDPYFSTKDKKTGTGLGLYMSKTIVYKHLNGTISVKNTNDGACFTMTIKREENV